MEVWGVLQGCECDAPISRGCCLKVKEIRNIEASVLQRLLNISRERNEDFNLILIRYASERLLYRLASGAVVVAR